MRDPQKAEWTISEGVVTRSKKLMKRILNQDVVFRLTFEGAMELTIETYLNGLWGVKDQKC